MLLRKLSSGQNTQETRPVMLQRKDGVNSQLPLLFLQTTKFLLHIPNYTEDCSCENTTNKSIGTFHTSNNCKHEYRQQTRNRQLRS